MNNNLSEIGARLSQYLKKKNYGVNQFGRITETSGAQISIILQGKKYGADKLLKILEVSPDLNPLWLLYGEGHMLKNSESFSDLPAESPQMSELQKENRSLLQENEKLRSKIENLSIVADLKDTMIGNLNNTIKIAQDSNKDLKEMLNTYKKLVEDINKSA